MSYDYAFTVFTPTFNRKKFLRNIYEDLKCQTFKNFEWLIVDDGSSDGTKDLVECWKNENIININYIYKKNGGKHTAINVGVKNARGELFFLADSDDRIVSNALEIMYKEWNGIDNKEGFCGIIGLFSYNDGNIVGTKFNEEYKDIPFVDVYKKYNIKGDKTVLFTTSIMREFPFPERDGIKFIMESVVWDEMSKKYNVKCINEVIQVKEYLDDGLTKSSYSRRILNGIAYSNLLLINQNTYPIRKYTRDRVWNYINLCSNSLLIGVNYFNEIDKFFDKFMYVLFYIRGYASYIRMKKYVK